MTRNIKLLVIVLFVITGVSLFTVLVNKRESSYKRGVSVEFDRAVNQAQALFQQKKRMGEDFSLGPCLTNDLMTGWVVDIVHNPRVAIDNEVRNQCQAYLEGRAKHFVELDLTGNVVRVQ